MRTKLYLSPEPCGVSENRNDPAKETQLRIIEKIQLLRSTHTSFHFVSEQTIHW